MKKLVSILITTAAIAIAVISCSKEPTPTPTPPDPKPVDTYTCVVDLDFLVNRQMREMFTITGGYTLGSGTTDLSDILAFATGWSISNDRAEVPCNTSFNMTFTPKSDFIPAEHDSYDVTFEYTYTVKVINQDGKEIGSVKKSDDIKVKEISFKKAAEKGFNVNYVLNELEKILDTNYKISVKADGNITVE